MLPYDLEPYVALTVTLTPFTIQGMYSAFPYGAVARPILYFGSVALIRGPCGAGSGKHFPLTSVSPLIGTFLARTTCPLSLCSVDYCLICTLFIYYAYILFR
jgi:hypothetical protein